MLRTSIFAMAGLAVRWANAVDVFAHFMVANAYGYDVDQWKADMKSARQVGIDGFSLNWKPTNCHTTLDWLEDRIDDAYTAAGEMNFKLYLSFDMDDNTCEVPFSQSGMQDIISRNSGKAAYRWNSNILVTTFGGDGSDTLYGNEFFQGLKDQMKSSNAISLAPALTQYSYQAQDDAASAASKLLSDFSSIDGYKNWQAWPLDVKENMTTAADEGFASALKKAGKTGPYIMTISPWQFKDLNDGNDQNAWVQYSDTLWNDRWSSLVGDDPFRPDIIEIISWNDWPESHYIRDLPSTDPSARDYSMLGDFENYVEGQNHSPWRIMAKYWIAKIKHNKKTKPVMDQVVFWYRNHPKDASCSEGTSTIRNQDLPDDAVFLWALVKEKSTISVSVGSNKYWEFEADPSEPATFMVPFPSDLGDGATPEVAVMRNGKAVQTGKGSKEITSSCDWMNFNPVVNLVGPGVNSGR